MDKIKLKDLVVQDNNIMFLRMFYNIQMEYGKTIHYILYIQCYDDIVETFKQGEIMISNWNQITLDHKYVFIGYDKICKISQIINENNQQLFVTKDENCYYFAEQL